MKVKTVPQAPFLVYEDVKVIPPPPVALTTGKRKFTLYLNEEFHEYLVTLAQLNHRNHNAQIVSMLAETAHRYSLLFEEANERE